MENKTVISTIMLTGIALLVLAIGIIFSQQWQMQGQLTHIEAQLGSTSEQLASIDGQLISTAEQSNSIEEQLASTSERLLSIEKQLDSTTWRIVYAHDENGHPTQGDINVLINAVEKGQPVRMAILRQPYGLHTTEAEHLWIHKGVVYAQNTSAVGISHEKDVPRFHDDSYYWMFVVNTLGDLDIIRWNVGEHVLRSHTLEKVSISWAIQ